MNLWEFRQLIEQMMPAWVMAIPIILLGIAALVAWLTGRAQK